MANPLASNETVTKLLDTNANPAPLGLMGFGLTTCFSTSTTLVSSS